MAIINGKKVEIHLKGGFSERKGIKHFSDIVQVNSLNERTRNKVYTVTKETFDLLNNYDRKFRELFVEYIYEEIFSLTKRDIPVSYNGIYNWNEVFDNIYNVFLSKLNPNILFSNLPFVIFLYYFQYRTLEILI